MCGIAGIVGDGWDRARLEAMVQVQHHRGPDDRGMYGDPLGRVGLGHNRLSIIDLSPSGHQPMANGDSTLWIVFNGEVYNYLELRDELHGYPFRSRTDTEVVLAAYERWGDACVERFIGMFAFAIWDARRRRLFCARDRLGIKPLYYAWDEGRFHFASEIKALLAAGVPAEADRATWAAYLVHGLYDHGPETFFQRVCSLPPGHTLTVHVGRKGPRAEMMARYWDLPTRTEEPLALSDDDAATRLSELLRDAVRLRLRSDVPVGVNLSGGLDSASLMVTVDDLVTAEDDVQTFTFAFEEPSCDEAEFAQRVPSRHRWVRNVRRLCADEVVGLATETLWHQEAPFGGIATLGYHNLHGLARDLGVTVLLEGQGVDEILAGYAYFQPHHYVDLLESSRGQELRRELRATGDKQRRRATLESVRGLLRGRLLNVYQDGTTFLAPETLLPAVRDLASERPEFPAPFQDRLTNVLYRDLRYTKLPRVLRMNDRLSMAFSRELREPYLDHRLVEFVFRLPAHQKIRRGATKYLLRHAMRGRLAERVRSEEKRHVVTPQREWLRGALRPFVEEIIHSRSFAERGWFDISRVRQVYREFCEGKAENSFFVWQWVNTELWFRSFIDRAVTGVRRERAPAAAVGSPARHQPAVTG